MKEKVKYIERDLILSPLYIGICTSKRAFDEELKRLKIKNYQEDWIREGKDATCHTLINKKLGTEAIIICIEKFSSLKKVKLVEYIGLIIHESVHVWQRICESLGEYNPSIEFEAYSIQNISQRLISEVIKL